MTVLFKNDFLDDFGQWPLAYTPYGGADFGELQAIAATVGDGGVDEYYAAFTGMAGRLAAEADAAAKAESGSAEQVFVTIAAGVTTAFFESKLPAGAPVIRVMPNAPALVGAGVSALAPGRFAEG